MDAAGALSDPDLFQDFIWNSIVYSLYFYISIFVFCICVYISLGLLLWPFCQMYLIGPVFNCSRTSVGNVQSQNQNRYINLQFFSIFTSLNKHDKYAVISRLLDLSAIVICYQVTDNALWELFSYLLSPSPPFWYCQGIGNWVLSDIDNFTYICLHENEFFRPLTLTGQKYGRLITV